MKPISLAPTWPASQAVRPQRGRKERANLLPPPGEERAARRG
ncbi:hypothetical protein [Caulobacter vibrioides]|uniref:Uncharacterized protein n=1 Tax=Caulobacter vibrioides (strain NA1000 / CB15N) TaxID=565050 RepID=A0A0H3CDP3_CAUVN|nr:hypothetical protein [Caulobacter vibrioides]YP_002519034.1 hypothetical protein CCNA_03661 [Caulobacter vibrioides NA1000]ACL97126.1 hypothetical protein CCNA_03661 [Caulobacter vibrioides NA1000]QXZ51886.1 hypothetical protein KZH45_18780 [Caulobacter vibrioides]